VTPADKPSPTFLSYAEFAKHIGATYGSVKRWVHEGMPKDRPGRVEVAVAEAWLAAHPRRDVAFNRVAVVYFATREDGAIKIGFSSDVPRRLYEVATKHHIRTPRLLATVSGNKRLENAIHREFVAHHLGREWYTPTPELLALVGRAHRGEPIGILPDPERLPICDRPLKAAS